MSKCESCGFAVKRPQFEPGSCGCSISQTIVKEVRECPFHAPISELCPLCGKPIPANTGFIPHNTHFLVCNDCGNHLYSCPTCKHQPACLIRNYTGPKPIHIFQEIKAGPITQRVQILNPELEEELCPTCICGSRTNCALLGRCNNYEFILKEEFEG